MASDPGGHGADIKPETASSLRDAAPTHHDEDRHKMDTQPATRVPVTVEPQPIPTASARIPVGDARVPRLRTELHRRRSQILGSGSGSGSPTRGTGVQKSTARPPEQAASLRKPGGAADAYRPGAAAAATRERMYQMLAAAASAEDSATLPTFPARTNTDDKQKTPLTRTRPIAIPRTRRNVDVEMREASMPPPPVPATTTTAPGSGASSAVLPSSLPLEARDDLVAPSSSGGGGGLKRSASNSSQTTVTVIEYPILEVDEQCGNNDEDLSWLGNDQELEQMLAMSSSHRRAGGARSSLAFRRSHEAAMQCSQVVRNVPRMRKRRGRKLDHRRHSMTMSESTICLSASPSPTSTPVG